LQTLPGYDSYRPSTPTNTTITENASSFNPLSSSTLQTPKTEYDIEKLALFAENSIHRNTPSSRSARTAVRLLAHSASYYCSSLNLRNETERKKKQYLIEESINSGKKGRKRIKVDNTAISAGDVKQVIRANFGGRHKAVKTSLDHYTRLLNSTEIFFTDTTCKLEIQHEREDKGQGGKRYKSVVQLEEELKGLEEKRRKYSTLVQAKKNEYGKLTAEEKNALEGLDGLEIEEGEKEAEEDVERVSERMDGTEVDDNVNTSW